MSDGLSEAKALLQDWLVILTSQYNQYGSLNNSSARNIDVTFAKYANMQMLPRLVYGLSRSRMLAADTSEDERIYLFSLLSSIEPGQLVRIVFPTMSSWQNADEFLSRPHPLSLEHIETEGKAVYMLDGLTELFIYYTARARDCEGLSFPPAESSKIRQEVARLYAERTITPRVTITQAGSADARLFERLMIEEPLAKVAPSAEAGAVPGMPDELGFTQYMEFIVTEVRQFFETDSR